MDIIYHPVSGEQMFAYTADENKVIQAILSDYNSQLEVSGILSPSSERCI